MQSRFNSKKSIPLITLTLCLDLKYYMVLFIDVINFPAWSIHFIPSEATTEWFDKMKVGLKNIVTIRSPTQVAPTNKHISLIVLSIQVDQTSTSRWINICIYQYISRTQEDLNLKYQIIK